MNVEPKFGKRRIMYRNRKYDDNVDNETVKTVEEIFRTDYFLYIVDHATSSLQSRFEQFIVYEGIFSFLFSIENLKSLDDTSEDASFDTKDTSFLKETPRGDASWIYMTYQVLRFFAYKEEGENEAQAEAEDDEDEYDKRVKEAHQSVEHVLIDNVIMGMVMSLGSWEWEMMTLSEGHLSTLRCKVINSGGCLNGRRGSMVGVAQAKAGRGSLKQGY
ncbi:zinc finger MYM-type protein 1 [Artemisia annua]|uniref:Zinc finger MYM-type protein 1 n=1 Tax=Artemisia annua TaxID=35608 RepID=A0A2U1QJ58_ARTAN|nr:zinc finger MYM-type protein 1 [Artemisia annua]